MKKLYILLLVIFVTKGTNSESDEIAKIIKPSTDEKTQQQAALNVIRRLIHEKADNVAIKVNFKLPINYFKVICISNGKNLVLVVWFRVTKIVYRVIHIVKIVHLY